jgi:hypothetical protein
MTLMTQTDTSPFPAPILPCLEFAAYDSQRYDWAGNDISRALGFAVDMIARAFIQKQLVNPSSRMLTVAQCLQQLNLMQTREYSLRKTG